jgi:uncharacterized phiE125 gp8 family phage protein
MHKSTLITPPAGELVSLDDAKRDLSLDGEDFDGTLSALLEAAVSFLDGYSGHLGCCLMTQTWAQQVSCFSRKIRLPLNRISSVEVEYQTAAGDALLIPATEYALDEDVRGAVIEFPSDFGALDLADTPFPITLRMQSGFGAAEDVPQIIRTAVLAIVSACIDGGGSKNWETIGPVRSAAANYRRVRL